MKTVSAALCIAWLLFQGLEAAAAAEVTSAQASKYTKQLENLVKGKRAIALEELIGELAKLDHPKVVGLIPVAATALPSARNHLAGVKALQGLQNEACLKELRSILKKPKGDYRQLVVIIEAFGKRTEPETLDAILEQFKSKVPQVQVAAVHACRDRKSRSVLPPLMEVLETNWKARDRLFLEVRLALVALTGQDFETLDDWKKYIESLPADFDPAKLGKETGKTAVALKKTNESVEFFGGEIFSRNLVFVIDVSGSMCMYDDDPSFTGKDVEKERQRLQRARDQLTGALKKLPRAARFNIITFSNKVLPWRKQMQPADPANVASAIKFVTDFKAIGATHTDEALDLAFQDITVDTIVLLSDGSPMKTSLDEWKTLIPKIEEKVKDTNASRRVRIDTFGFEGQGQWPSKGSPFVGKPPPAPTPEETKSFVEFLKKLAEDSGGTYRPIN